MSSIIKRNFIDACCVLTSQTKREMSDETSTESHLSVVMTTDQDEMTQTTGETLSSSRGAALYFQCFVVVIGVIGTAANGLILYALIASKQHKKQMLIVNQNVLDLYSCLFLVITYGLKLANIWLSGSSGYFICTFVLSDNLLVSGSFGSSINLIVIAIDRYLKVCHNVWSKKNVRMWMIYVAMIFVWISGFVYHMSLVFDTSVVINGVCYAYAIVKRPETKLVSGFYYFISTYVIVLLIPAFCYWKILMTIRRQARVMASHNPAGSSSAQTQSNKIQSSVIKTMILVCAFYAIAWMPEKTIVLLFNLDLLNVNALIMIGYHVSIFLGFFYICANPFIYAIKFGPVRRVLKGLFLCKEITEPGTSGLKMNSRDKNALE